MATFNVRAPDGSLMKISGPEDATDEELIQIAEQNYKPKKETTLGGNVKEAFKGVIPGGIGLLETAGAGASALLPEEYEKPTRQFIQEAAAAGRKPFEAAPGYEESVGRKLGEGIGSTLPFFAMGPAGVAGRLGAGALGVAAGAGEARQAAEAKGATPEERRTATQLGAPVGLLDILAPEIGPLKNIVTTALARGGVEGATEAAQKIAQNLIAKGVYDPKQDVLAGSGEEGAYGAGVGALASLIVDMALGRRAHGVGVKPAPATPLATPDQATEQPTPLALGMEPPFKPVDLPDGSVATTKEDFDAYQEMARRSNGNFPILNESLISGTAIGLPSGAAATTPAELDAYRQQQQFGSNLLAQPVDVKTPGLEEATPAGAQAPAAMAGFTGAPNANIAMMEQARAQQAAQAKQEIKDRQAKIKEVMKTPFSADPLQDALARQKALEALGVPAQQASESVATNKEPKLQEPPAFVEARPIESKKAVPVSDAEKEEIKTLRSDLQKVNAEIATAKQEGTDLFNRLKGALHPDDVTDIAPTEKGGRLRMLASKSGGQMLSNLVADGSLNEFLPPDMRITEPGQDETAGVEYIKEALRNGDTRSFDSKVALQALEKSKEDLKSRIEEPKALQEANLQLGQVAEEQAGYEGLPTDQLIEQAKQLGVDTDSLVEDVAKRTPELSAEQYHGEVRNALISEINTQTGTETLAQAKGEQKGFTASKQDLKTQSELKGKSMIQVAQWAIKNAPNSFSKFVGEKVLARLKALEKQGVTLNFEIADGNRRNNQLYSAQGITNFVWGVDGNHTVIGIELNGAPVIENQLGYPSGLGYDTVMHELLHAATRGQMRFLASTDPMVKDLRDLYNKVVEHFNSEVRAGRITPFMEKIYKRSNNALRSPDELISWGLTDKDMQDFLNEIKVGEKTVMDKIVQLVRELLGIPKSFETALDRLVRTTDKLLEADVKVLANGMVQEGYTLGRKPGQQTLFSKRAQELFGKETLAKEEGVQKTPTGAGVDSMRILESIGRGNQEAEPGYKEKIRQAWDNARDNPKATAEAAKAATTSFLDRVETWTFSSDAGLNNAIRREIENSTLSSQEKIGILLNTSLSQTVHSDAVASLFLQRGGIKYNNELHKWEGVDNDSNFVKLSKQLDALADKNGLTKQQAELVAHTAFEAKRLRSLVKFNEELSQKIADIKAEAASKRSSSPVAASALSKEAARLKDQFKFISEDQLAMIEPGMELFKIHPELNNVVKTWNEIRTSTVNTLVETGLWSENEAEEMLSNADYVPFYREDQLENNQGPKEFIRGLQVQAKEKRLKGSSRPVNDIFDNQVRWVQYSINRAVRNRSALALADTAVEVGAAKQVESRKDGDNVVRVWRDGKEQFFSMDDPMFMEAFTGLEAIVIPSWKWASNMANMLRQSVVMYPLFSVAQVPQDSFAAIFSSGLKPQHALRIPVLAVKEFVQTLRGKSKTHEELKNVGAVGVRDFTSAMVRLDAEIYAGLRAPPGVAGKIKYALNHIAMAADNAVRQAVYEASMSQGLSRAEAMEKAFEVFNVRRKGSSKSLALAGQLIPFFNAYLAAQNVAYKTITGRGISPTARQDAFKTLAATTASVMALSLMYAMLNGDDDDYLKKPATQRDKLLMIPGTGGMSLPLRADLFTMPKIITEHMYLMMTDKGYEDGRKFRDSMKAALGSALLGPTAVPQAIKPLVEVGINYDFFQGRPLVGTYQQKLDTERQFTDTTSELGKILGKTGLVSPIAADHLVRGMFGSAGGLIIYATNPILHSDPNTPRPSLSEKDAIATLPGMSGFMAKSYESALKKDFYTLKEEVDKAANTLNDLKTRSPQEIEGFLANEENLSRVGLQKSVNAIGERLSNIRKAITQTANSSMPADEKQQRIEMLHKAEEDMLKGVDVKKLRELGKI